MALVQILNRQVVGIVVYRYCGSYVSNPALGSAGVLMKKVCYGLALPGVLLSTVLITHVNPPPRFRITQLTRSSPPNSFSSDSSETRNTSPRQLRLTGWYG